VQCESFNDPLTDRSHFDAFGWVNLPNLDEDGL
jgi:hypothetical protein